MLKTRSTHPETDTTAFPTAGLSNVVGYYRETIEDYHRWSPEGYMHFGYWRWGDNPFNRRAMIEGMNDLVFDQLKLDSTDDSERELGTQKVVADLGCGLGAVSNYGSKKFPNHKFLAFTLSPEQVECGTARLENDRVEMKVANFLDLPLPDNSLDAAFFLESLCHSEEPEKALAEALRVLKPGGRLVVVDGFLNRSRQRTSAWVKWLAHLVSENWAVPDFHAYPAFRKQVDRVGFVVESSREIGWNITPSVAHSPWLVGTHTIQLALRGQLTSWKRKHLIACGLGVVLGMHRWSFGYHIITTVKK
jgi:ubiquinone/menaquinone biosynthesis C-methylase UbiE